MAQLKPKIVKKRKFRYDDVKVSVIVRMRRERGSYLEDRLLA
jgi:hypothetical protein